jgi:hypothetical protein
LLLLTHNLKLRVVINVEADNGNEKSTYVLILVFLVLILITRFEVDQAMNRAGGKHTQSSS